MPYSQLASLDEAIQQLTRWAILVGIPLTLLTIGGILFLILKRR